MAKTQKLPPATDQVVKGNSSKSKKTRKSSASRVARNEAYKASGRREVNKAIKLFRHFERRIGAGLDAVGEVRDFCAGKAWDAIPQRAKDAARTIIQAHRDRCAAGQMGIQVGG